MVYGCALALCVPYVFVRIKPASYFRVNAPLRGIKKKQALPLLRKLQYPSIPLEGNYSPSPFGEGYGGETSKSS